MSLPDRFAVRLAEGVSVRDGGRTLLGGAPTRLTRLSAAAVDLLRDGTLVVEDPASGLLAERLLASGVAEPVTALLDEVALDQVTCVVPVRDRPAGLDRLLAGLAGTLDVVVVDDASRDGDGIARVADRHGARLVRLPTNRGPAAARNAGLGEVSTAYVLFVDSDATIEPAAVSRLMRHVADPGLALVAPRILGSGGESWIARYESVCSSLDLGPRSALVRPMTRVAWVPSAVLLGRVEALGDGFDESLVSGEDVDLVWRLDRAGWRVRYDARVRAHHDHRVRLGPWLRRKAFYGSSAAALAGRHGDTVAPAVLTPAGAAAVVAVLAQRRWSVPVVGALTAVNAVRLRSSTGDDALAVELATRGMGTTLGQLSPLLLRHWWPATALACVVSRRARRAVLAAVVADVATHRGVNPVARRLDDLAYGAGVWCGALGARSIRCLLPALRPSRARSGPSRRGGRP